MRRQNVETALDVSDGSPTASIQPVPLTCSTA